MTYLKNKYFLISFFILLSGIYIFGCTSRYRLDLFLQTDNFMKRVKVEQTQFVKQSEIADPFADTKIIPGNNNTIILTVSTRIKKETDISSDVPQIFGFDEYWKSHLYLNIPENITPGKFDLQNNSLVNVLGKYDLKPEDKIFLPQSGSYMIDSVTSSQMFITIEGSFINQSSVSLSLNGQFKVKIS